MSLSIRGWIRDGSRDDCNDGSNERAGSRGSPLHASRRFEHVNLNFIGMKNTGGNGLRGNTGTLSEEQVRFESGSRTLNRTILIPDEPGQKLVMVLAHGSGPGHERCSDLWPRHSPGKAS